MTDPLPVPPLRLRRVLLHGVGPDGARFDPLDLDFSTTDGAASRILLSLTNTGGKSTWITLVTSLIVPASRAQVSGKNLGDYVLTSDTSHVVCEWEDSTTSTRTVTGTVMEWKDGRRQPGHKQRSTTNMHRAWYLFRTGVDLPGIDDLPFVVDGRRSTFAAFLESVDALLTPHPGAQWVVARTQQEWAVALDERTSIDPVLFGYQMRMNDSEAGAEKLLSSFDSPDNVIRFFVAALNDDRDIADFTGKLGAYADLASQRTQLEDVAAFGTEIQPLIGLIASRARAAEDAVGLADKVLLAGGEHAGALDNRVRKDRTVLEELAEAASAAVERHSSVRREYGQISDIRLQLQLEAAKARLAAAEAAVATGELVAGAARSEAEAWAAVDTVLDIAIARTKRDTAQAAYDIAESGLSPLRRRVQELAAALAGRLDALAADALHQAGEADGGAATASAEATIARDEQWDAKQRLDVAKAELVKIEQAVRVADEAGAAARGEGWLVEGERPRQCLVRWGTARAGAVAERDRQDKIATVEEAAFDSVSLDVDAVELRLPPLRSAAQQHRDALTAFDTDFAVLAADETLVVLLGGPPRELDDLVRATDLADRAAHEADGRASDFQALADAAQRELAHLDDTGTAPAGADTLTVLNALRLAGIGAVTGLQWIEHNVADPESRAGRIAANPGLAGGVVITDWTRFDLAAELLTTSEPRTRTPVTVTVAPRGELDAVTSAERTHVVVPHRATWDSEWASATRDGLESTVLEQGEFASRARSAAGRYREMAAGSKAFTSRWQHTSRPALVAQAESALAEVTEEERLRTTWIGKRDGHRDGARAARGRRETAREEIAVAETAIAAVEDLVLLSDAAAEAAQRRPIHSTDRRDAETDLAAAKIAEESAQASYHQCVQEAARLRGAREPWLRERADLGVEHAGADPGGNIDIARESWKSTRDRLAAAEQGMVEAGHLNQAQEHLSQMLSRRDRHSREALERAEQLSGATSASSRESLVGAQRQAAAQDENARMALLRAQAERDQATGQVRSAEPPTDRVNHVDLSRTPEWEPESPDDIPELLARLEIRNRELLAAREAAEQAEDDARKLHDVVSADIAVFTDVIGMWSADAVPTDALFAGSKEAARDRMRGLVRDLKARDDAQRTAQDELRNAVNRARAVAVHSRWKELATPVAVRVRSLPDAALVEESEVLASRISAVVSSAEGDLRGMDQHREILRDGLTALCREQRRLLREVGRSSRLPEGLGELSDQQAIKIRFEEAPADEAAARLAARVDSWAVELAANPKRAASAEVRARWLADAVRDTVLDRTRAGAWTIEILKPRIDGKVVYCPPDRIPQEFSGGQVLTLAVLVYCALSKVRTAHRPGGARPPGTLILDNPFGAASAEALIEMQHRLAARTGLQLVCATGLHDAGVDAAFTGVGSVVVKLRNDGDQRRNLSFLRLGASVVDGVDVPAAIVAGRDPAAKTNWVDGIRYEVRR